MTPDDLAQRRRVLFTMLTALGFRYPPGREPAVITGIRQYLGGWPGIGRAASPWSPRARTSNSQVPAAEIR